MIKKYQYHILVLLAGISWSTLAIFSQTATQASIDPFNQVFWRILVSGFTSLIVAIYIFKEKINVGRKELYYFLINAFLFLFGFTTFSASIYLGSPIAKAIALNYSYPLAVVILSYLLFKDIPTRKNILAILLSFISVFLLLEVWKINNLTQISLGDFLAWLNSFAFGGIIVWGTKIRRELKVSPFTTLFYSWLLAIPLLLIFGLIMQALHISLFNPILETNFSLSGWLSLIGLGTISSVLPLSLMYFGSSKLKPFVTSVLLLSEVICVYLAGIVLFGQQLSFWGIIGMIGIAIAVLLT